MEVVSSVTEDILNKIDMELEQYTWLDDHRERKVHYLYNGRLGCISVFNFEAVKRVYYLLSKKGLTVTNKLEHLLVKDLPYNHVFICIKKTHRFIKPKNEYYSISYFTDSENIYDITGRKVVDLEPVYLNDYIRIYKKGKKNTTKIKIPDGVYIKEEDGKLYTNVYIPIETDSVEKSKSFFK